MGWGTAREIPRVLSARFSFNFTGADFPCTFFLGACLSESANHSLLLLLENTDVAEYIRSRNKQTAAESASRVQGRLPHFHGTLAFSPPEVPGPVCGFSCDTCFQPPKCWGGLPDFHGTLAFSPQKRLGRFVDLPVTLAVLGFKMIGQASRYSWGICFQLPEAPGPVCGFSFDYRFQFPKVLRQASRFSWYPCFQPPEAPWPVCGFSHDIRFQLPNCLGRLLDFHGTLAFSLRAKVPGQAPRFVVGNVRVRPWAFPT
jgi:hypothetical protein